MEEDADGRDIDRNETDDERWDRNWTDIQQELRIVQTGTQILAGFLLTLPFQQRFGMLSEFERTVYLFLVALAATITILALGAVATHRMVFRRHQKHGLVRVGNAILLTDLVLSAILFAGTVLFVYDVVLGRSAGVLSGVVVFVGTAILWTSLPLTVRRSRLDRNERRR
jgi:hypothetical protein